MDPIDKNNDIKKESANNSNKKPRIDQSYLNDNTIEQMPLYSFGQSSSHQQEKAASAAEFNLSSPSLPHHQEVWSLGHLQPYQPNFSGVICASSNNNQYYQSYNGFGAVGFNHQANCISHPSYMTNSTPAISTDQQGIPQIRPEHQSHLSNITDIDWEMVSSLFGENHPDINNSALDDYFLDDLATYFLNDEATPNLSSDLNGSGSILDKNVQYDRFGDVFFNQSNSAFSAKKEAPDFPNDSHDDRGFDYPSISFINLQIVQQSISADVSYSAVEYPELNLEFYSTKQTSISEDAFFILANDVRNILIPQPTQTSRTIIVINASDFTPEFLRINQFIDFMVINNSNNLNLKKIAFQFALLSRFKNIILFDSTISKIIVKEHPLIDNSTNSLFHLLNHYKENSLVVTLPFFSKKRSTSVDLSSTSKIGTNLLFIDIASISEIIDTNRKPGTEKYDHSIAKFFFLHQGGNNIDDYFLQMFINEISKKHAVKKGFSQISSNLLMMEKSTTSLEQDGLSSCDLNRDFIEAEESLFPELVSAYVEAFKKLTRFIDTKINPYQEASELTSTEVLSKYSIRQSWSSKSSASSSSTRSFLSQSCADIVRGWESIRYKETQIFKHQIDAIDAIGRWSIDREEEPLICKNILSIEMATGTGKTLVESLVAFAGFNANKQSNIMIICPTINLVQQMYLKIAEYQEHISGLPASCYVSPDSVIAISSEQAHLDKKLMAVNTALKSKHHLFIICQKSFLDMLESDEQVEQIKLQTKDHFSKLIRETSLYIADESHQVLSSKVINKLLEKKSTTSSILAFSATQSELVKKMSARTSFNYKREQAILDKIITPLIIDRSIDAEITPSIILNLTLNHEHLGLRLYNQKGIILVNQLEEIRIVLSTFNDSEEFRNCGTNLFVVSSKTRDNEQTIKNFLEAEKGIMIGIEIPATGLDHDRLTWVICSNSFKSAIEKSKDPYHEPTLMKQMIGRTLRFSRSIPNKTGLFITQNILSRNNRVISWHPTDQSAPEYRNFALQTLKNSSQQYDEADVSKKEFSKIDG